MIFLETLNSLRSQVEDALDELFRVVESNQTHEQDLLLVQINGFYNKEKTQGFSPFVFGPGGWISSSDFTQYRFFDTYRRQIIQTPRVNFFSDYGTNQEKQSFCDFTTQIELMVFLKFWESDVILKRLYQLSNLAIGKNYDWHFNLVKDDSRHTVIRELIRDPIQSKCPKYFQLLRDIYLSQIRNAAAHSKFYIEGQTIGFNNYDPKNHAPLSTITFEEWELRFHKLILLYNGLIGKFNISHEKYIDQQKDKEFGLQIRMTDPDGKENNQWIKYADTEGKSDWMWYDNWKKHYKYKS